MIPISPMALSFIEVFLISAKFILASHAASPPSLKEAAAIAHELGEGCAYSEQSDPYAAGLHGGIEEDNACIKEKGQQRKHAHGDTQGLLHPGRQGKEEHDTREEAQEQQHHAHGEHHRQQMYEFEALGVFLVEVDARDATVVDLPPELAEVGAPLVPHPCLGKEATLASGLEDTDGEVDVLAEAHLGEPAEPLVYVAAHTHVERAGIELVELLLAATDATSGEKGGHAVGNGLLHGSEGVGGTVGTAEGIGRLALQLGVDSTQVVFGHHHIGVEYEDILALGTLHAIIAALTGTAVGLHIIMYVEPSGILAADVLAGNLRAVLHDYDLKVGDGLTCEAV